MPGRVGQSLLDVAQMHDIELESGCGGGGAEQQKKHSERWTEDLFGRGECGRGGKRGDERGLIAWQERYWGMEKREIKWQV